jgi:drug/metabolite transporter (DMT)-like permease
VVVIPLALAAALVFAIGAVMQQHAASGQPLEHNMRPALVTGLFRRPLWLGGIAMNGLGTLIQLAALWRGSLVTVQPLLVCGLLFALPINAVFLHRRRPGMREVLGAGAVCIGLTGFLLATSPTPGRGSAGPFPWAVSLSCLATAVAVLIGVALVCRGVLRAGLLALAAGIVNGLSAAFIKGIARRLEAALPGGVAHGLLSVLSYWELYAFAATLVVALLVVQSAYQSGPIRWSLPALTAANPVTSVILGATVLGERVHTGPLDLLGAVLGLGLVVAGILGLSSSGLITGDLATPPASAVLEAD